MSWKVAVSRQLKRVPPVFDAARRTVREIAFIQIGSNDGYLRRRDLSFFNVAVFNEEGAKQFCKIKDTDLQELAPFACQVGSFDCEHILKHFPAYPSPACPS
jgi:hypothetical protein